RNSFVSALPRTYTKAQLETIDDDGVVKVGTKVNTGDPLVLALGKKQVNLAKTVSRTGALHFTDDSQTWQHEDAGVVTGVHRAKNGDVVVSVGAVSPLKGADKLSELFGTKGIVKIIPDDEMVTDENGVPYEIVSSDLGVISRKNSS